MLNLKHCYDEKILPHLINATCASAEIMTYRQKVVPLAFGHVLEIGMGSALNLSLYDTKKVTKIWGLEPSTGMRKKAAQRVANASIPVAWLDLPSENIPLADESVDSIVMTFTLCSIANWQTALAEMRRVLKPTGKLFFCEHGLAPEKHIQVCQHGLNPLWKRLAGGCHLNRATVQHIHTAGFRTSWVKHAYLPKSPKFAGYISYGEAIK